MLMHCALVVSNVIVVYAIVFVGVVEEYDAPERLLQNESSLFSQLVAEYTTRSSTTQMPNSTK